MDVSTIVKRTRVEQCKLNAKLRSEKKRQAALDALSTIQQEKHPVTKATVAQRAGVSVVFLRSHPDLIRAIEEAENAQPATFSTVSPSEQAKDQVIAALRRRLEEAKQQIALKDVQVRAKQREIDHLYGKLAAASPLTDAELRQMLLDSLQRLKQQE